MADSQDKYDVSGVDSGFEKIPENRKYFIVGLSGGISSAQAGERLTISIDLLRYVDSLKDGGDLVIFDVQNLGRSGVDKEAFDLALEEMEIRLKGVAMSQGGDVNVVNASSVVSENRENFDFLVSEIKEILREDNFIQEKIWKIIPPSAKSENLQYAKFSDVPAEKIEEAYSLMEYEVLHLAFILSNDGTKIAHGRSEERSVQVVKYLKEKYGERLGCADWIGKIEVGKVDAPRIFPDKYPLPYGLASAENTPEQTGSLTVSANISHVYKSVIGVLERGGEDRLRKYFATLMGLEGGSDKLDFSDPKAVYLTTAFLVKKCTWPVELGEIVVAKNKIGEGKNGDFEKRVSEKCSELEETLKLSPQLKVIIEDLMPVFFRESGEGPKERLRWLFEGLYFGGVVCHLANKYERNIMTEVLLMIAALYVLFDPERKELLYDPWWIDMMDFAEEFYFEELDNPRFAGEGMVEPEEQKFKLMEPLRQIAKVLKLDGDFGDNLELLKRRIEVMDWDNYCPISLQSRNLVLRRVILPYLDEKRKGSNKPKCVLGGPFSSLQFFKEFVEEKTKDLLAKNGGEYTEEICDSSTALQHLCLILLGFEKDFRDHLMQILPVGPDSISEKRSF